MVPPSKKFRIAERLAQARRAFLPALSQAGLAERVRELGLADCKASRISRLEAGYADAQWSEIETLAKVLNFPAQWLAGTNELTESVLPVPPPLSAPPAPSMGPTIAQPPVPVEFPAAIPNATPPAGIVPLPERVDSTSPDLADLERSAYRSDYDHRQHLAAALSRARAKLHEAGLPAAQWRQWRLVEKKAVDELRKCCA